MKLLRYGPPGEERPALLDEDDTLRDLSAVVADIAGEALTPEGLQRIAAVDARGLPAVTGSPRLGPCVGRSGKFVCIGLNYSDHARETGASPPPEPVIFGKWTSAIAGPHDPIEIPRGSTCTDWEVELGVVIGRGGRYLDEASAMEHVAGYCVINDVSEREFQLRRSGKWDKGKGCDSFGPIGPWLVTRDEIPDPQALRLWLEVDGERRQDSSTARMIFPVRQLVRYVSQFMSLQPGDLIATGTPAGVALGMPEPRYLRPGQRLRLGIDGLGEQSQEVVQAP